MYNQKTSTSTQYDKRGVRNDNKRKEIQHDGNVNTKDAHQEFRQFLSDKLFEFIESQIEEVEVQDSDSELFHFEVGDVSLFPGSPILKDELIPPSVSNKHPPSKKKKKIDKDLEKERIKEAAVSVDWIRQQAKLFTS
ncbi:uncharacterized protein [Parasteatoda tepidariorum]|uniref:uncharacterized protein n=1 Tax=Parasteatoda tepidariorum TaxID=114398 RepID=UPI001C7248B7|nr:uncharacterized protein LOC107448437 [Parasteatoda tepidariorum]